MTHPAAFRRGPAERLVAYLKEAWRGRVPLARFFFVDMLVWGSIVNLTTSAVALALFASGAPAWAAVSIWVLPWPMNAFLCICVWRTAAGARTALSEFAGPLATLWALAISLI